MRKIIRIQIGGIALILAIFFTSCSCNKYDDLNDYIGSTVLDTIPVRWNDDNSIRHYKYKINYNEKSTYSIKFTTLRIKIEDHYFVPGDIISFEKPFNSNKNKDKISTTKNNFIE